MSGRPLVTVVTPSFNYAPYLGACLGSVRAQTYPHLEHLVLDACSSDGSADVIRSFQGTYTLQAFFEKDRGPADALNRGFDRARGEIFCWLNADDFWLHERVVQEAVEALEQVPADLVTAAGRFVDREGRRLRPCPVDSRRTVSELRYSDTVLQPATFWRRSAHRELRADLQYTFDWRLWLDMQRAGARFQALDCEWAAYRLHDANRTTADPAARRREVAEILADSCGRSSAQHLWARAVYGGYRLAEALGSRTVKRAVQLANIAMYKVSRRRIVSC